MEVETEARGSWAGRPQVALLVRASYLVIPLLAALLASVVLVQVQVLTNAPMILRWVLVLAATTVVLAVTHRALARLLPLAALLELSIVFPGPAPSRYAVARDAGNPARLKEIVARAQRGDPLVDLRAVEAARDILGLVAALGSHDAQTRGHAERVRVFTDLIAEQLHITGTDREHLRWAALLHDVGKLDVSSAVLNKTEKLTDSDWSLLRTHPAAGARIAQPLNEWLGRWADTIGQHHEKYDGTGYPNGIAGEQICLGARIVAVADAFDVMTAARSYRKPIGRAAALRELTNCSGSQFDPRVVRAMLAVSTPRLRVAMGPVSWLGAAPFLAATQGAATVAAQATAGVLVAGTVVVAGPAAASSSPDLAVSTRSSTPAQGGTHTGTAGRPTASGSGGTATGSSTAAPSPSRSGTPTPKGAGKPTAKPTPKGTGKPTAKPTRKETGKPTAKPTAATTGATKNSPNASGHGKP